MKEFLIKILIFSLSILIFFTPAFIILKCTGESYTSLKSLIEENNPYLVGYAYSDDAYKFLQWYNIHTKSRFDVLSIGSSRVTQFREKMFSSRFYNSSFTVFRISEFIPYLNCITPNKYPQHVIIGLDQWMFTDNFSDEFSHILPASYWTQEYIDYPNNTTYTKVYKDILRGKYNLNILFPDTSIMKVGINARVNNFGIRNDGSLSYGRKIDKFYEQDTINFFYAITKIENNEDLFGWTHSVYSQSLNELFHILDFCHKRKIDVTGFCPPFTDTIYNMMIESGNYQYLDKLPVKLDSIFKIFDYEFFNYPTASSCNSNDLEFIDGFHGSEVSYARLLLDMLSKGSKLNELVDQQRLNDDLKNKINRYKVYK